MKRTEIYRILVWIIVSVFLVNRVIVYSYATEIGDVRYVEISDELINSANNEDNYNIKVSSYEEIYGMQLEEISDLSYEDIAKFELCSYFGENNFDNIHLSNGIRLYDANDINTYIGYNYDVNGVEGYITVATHTRTALVREVNEIETLPADSQKVYYLSLGEIYYLNGNNYYTLENKKIGNNEFKELLRKRKEELLNLNIGILSNIELDSISQINNLLCIKEYGDDWYLTEKKYSGQEGYGYGGIVSCEKYLKSKYGLPSTRVEYRSLNFQGFVMDDLEPNANNCVLTAITNILYYYKTKGYNFVGTKDDIYSKVKSVAKKYGYSAKKGTDFWDINDIVNKVLGEYGYVKAKCRAKYRYTFKEEVKNEIDNKRPVIMNIAFGYYGNHTVTVCGYEIYNEESPIIGNRKHNMIEVYDGWSAKSKYIDYEAFSYELLTGASFNIIKMK